MGFDVITSPGRCDALEYFHPIDVVPKVCFYNISNELNELWIKNETKGLFLELWLYHSLKDYFKEDDEIGVYHSVKVRKHFTEHADSVDELLEDVVETEEYITSDESEKDTGNDITEIDVLITKDNTPFCAIECKYKDNGYVGMSDVLKLKGVMSLLNIERGVLFTKTFAHSTENNQIFDNTFVVSNVVKNESSWSDVIDIIQT